MKPVLFAAGLLLALGSTAQAAPTDDAAVDRITQGLTPPVQVEGRVYPPKSLTELMAERRVPAVSIAFVDHGQIAWTRAYGLADVAGGRKATPDTLFQAGSISKPVAATGMLTLVQEGRLKLDVPVNAQLKSWKLPDNGFTRAQPVTLRHLLTHTGSLTVHGFPGYEPGKPVPTVQQVLDGAPPANTDPVRVDGPVGKEWRYSGGGITIAQLMTAEADGRSFPALMQARVLAPFGMASSTYEQPLPKALRPRAATGYRAKGAAIPGRYNTYPEMAAAGLWTTPSDVARWTIGIADADAGRSSPVLSQATAKAMLTPGLGDWGLGVEVKGQGQDRRFSHGGANEGFRNEMFAFPARGQAVVIMTNSDAGGDVMGPLLTAIAQAYGWPGFERKTIKPAPVKPGELAAYAGAYALGNVTITVRERPGGQSLELVAPGDDIYELIPQGSDTFADASSASPAKFERDAGGKVGGLDFAGVKLTRKP
jgi:CubicO group peptidase (beta-lactamase class C family)